MYFYLSRPFYPNSNSNGDKPKSGRASFLAPRTPKATPTTDIPQSNA